MQTSVVMPLEVLILNDLRHMEAIDDDLYEKVLNHILKTSTTSSTDNPNSVSCATT